MIVFALAVVLMAPTASAASFRSGTRVQVRNTGGSGLNVRSGPGLRYGRVARLGQGRIVTVVSGPVWRNGYGWYKVRGFSSYGRTGWSAGNWLYRAGSGVGTGTGNRGGVVRGERYRVLATGYNGAEFGSTGYMRNGRRVHWGAVAVDPRYIPMGTRMYISGYGNKIFMAEDTGGAIKGWRIDIWFSTVQQARNHAAQWRTVTLIR